MAKPIPVVVAGVEYASLNEAARRLGLCKNAVRRRLNSGWTMEQAFGVEPAPRGPNTSVEAVLKRYTVNESGCWEWSWSLLATGYGAWPLVNRDGISKCHRAAYHYLVGPIPKGMLVRHKCDNRKCINPDHLELGTHQDNMRDEVNRGRSLKGMRNHKARMNEQDVAVAREFCQRFPPKPGRHGMAGSVSFLARWFGVSHSAMLSAVRKATWRHVA